MKPKTCHICRIKFEPSKPMQKCCGWECAQVYGRMKRVKEEVIKDLADRKVLKEKIARLKPGYLEGKAQDAINAYVRVRDHEDGCISCDKPANWNGQWHASHLKSRGANSFLRYNLWNLHKSCSVCNNHNSGNVAEYERRVVKKIGQERFDFIQNAPRIKRYDDDYLIRLASVFRKKTRILKKRKGIE